MRPSGTDPLRTTATYEETALTIATPGGKRQRLKGEIDSIIARNHKTRDVIAHFTDADKDIPIWAIFEVMTLGNFGVFYDCLDVRVKRMIAADLGMPTNLDSPRALKAIIFTLKDFRNAIAHNGVVIDVRFKDHKVSRTISDLLEHDMGVGGVDFNDITDYIVLLSYLMVKTRYSKTECRQFIASYSTVIEKYRSELPFPIYSKLVQTAAKRKLVAARDFIKEQ